MRPRGALLALMVLATPGGLVACGPPRAGDRPEAARPTAAVEAEPAGVADTALAERWHELERRTLSRLRAVRAGATSTGERRETSRRLARAELRLAAARRLAENGRLELAVSQAETALARLTELETAAAARLARFTDPANLELWQGLVGSTLAGTRGGREVIVVDKLERRLSLFRRGKLLTSFAAELGTDAVGPKTREGDGATPEGLYRVLEKRAGNRTRYHKALLLDYPNKANRRRFDSRQRSGQAPPDASIGGLIEIHGDGGVGYDWTDGCVALTNRDMDELFRQVEVGTPVVIVGTY